GLHPRAGRRRRRSGRRGAAMARPEWRRHAARHRLHHVAQGAGGDARPGDGTRAVLEGPHRCGEGEERPQPRTHPGRPLCLEKAARLTVKAWLLSLLAATAAGAAEPHRWALAVGENRGLSEDPPLRYAQSDARHLLQVLEEVGDLDPSRAMLVAG